MPGELDHGCGEIDEGGGLHRVVLLLGTEHGQFQCAMENAGFFREVGEVDDCLLLGLHHQLRWLNFQEVLASLDPQLQFAHLRPHIPEHQLSLLLLPHLHKPKFHDLFILEFKGWLQGMQRNLHYVLVVAH